MLTFSVACISSSTTLSTLSRSPDCFLIRSSVNCDSFSIDSFKLLFSVASLFTSDGRVFNVDKKLSALLPTSWQRDTSACDSSGAPMWLVAFPCINASHIRWIVL